MQVHKKWFIFVQTLWGAGEEIEKNRFPRGQTHEEFKYNGIEGATVPVFFVAFWPPR